jgi:hypothetical protein
VSEHLPEHMIGETVYAHCPTCHRTKGKFETRHRVDRARQGTHAGKVGPCLEHQDNELTQAQRERRAKARQGNLFK